MWWIMLYAKILTTGLKSEQWDGANDMGDRAVSGMVHAMLMTGWE